MSSPESRESVLPVSELDAVIESGVLEFGKMYPHQHPMKGLARFSEDVALEVGWDPLLALGVADRIRINFSNNKGLLKQQIAEQTLGLVACLESMRKSTPYHKARSFNYLVDPGLPIEHFVDESVENARFWIALLGPDYFGRTAHKKRLHHHRANIGNSDFSLTAKPGSGAGTFSIDFAIAYNRYGDDRDFEDPAHELWRLGVDTAIDPESGETIGRIIRTGGATKQGDEKKARYFDEFKRNFSSMPHRLLTFCALYAMYELGFDKARALTTDGANTMSTLRNSKGGVDYTALHSGLGFRPTENKWWLGIDRLQETLPELASLDGSSVMFPHEPSRIDQLIDAFNNLSSIDNEPFPIKIFQNNNKAKLAREIIALLKLQGHRWFGKSF